MIRLTIQNNHKLVFQKKNDLIVQSSYSLSLELIKSNLFTVFILIFIRSTLVIDKRSQSSEPKFYIKQR